MKLLRIGKKGHEIPVAIDKSGKYKNLSAHINDLNPDTINFETLDILKNINLENLDEINCDKVKSIISFSKHIDLKSYIKSLKI